MKNLPPKKKEKNVYPPPNIFSFSLIEEAFFLNGLFPLCRRGGGKKGKNTRFAGNERRPMARFRQMIYADKLRGILKKNKPGENAEPVSYPV